MATNTKKSRINKFRRERRKLLGAKRRLERRLEKNQIAMELTKGGDPRNPRLPRAKFGFNQRVIVAQPAKHNRHLLGRWGTVIGRARETDGRWGYAVGLDGSDECLTFQQEELNSDGSFREPPKPSEVKVVRVRVDERGRGTIVRD